MLQYDLTNTQLARCRGLPAVPSEGELHVIMIGLLLLDGLSYLDLTHRRLELSPDRYEPLAQLIQHRLTPLAKEFGTAERLRHRLAELVGIRITRQCM